MTFAPATKFIPVIDGGEKQPERSHVPSSGSNIQPPSFARATGSASRSGGNAYQRGFEDGKAAALAELEERMSRERESHAKQLELERYTLASRETDQLAEQISGGLSEIEGYLSNMVARILRPFLNDVAQNNAIAELLAALDMVVGANEGITLEISGPDDLLEILREKLASTNVAVQFTSAQQTDVRMVAGQTIIETCLGTWMRRVEESLK